MLHVHTRESKLDQFLPKTKVSRTTDPREGDKKPEAHPLTCYEIPARSQLHTLQDNMESSTHRAKRLQQSSRRTGQGNTKEDNRKPKVSVLLLTFAYHNLGPDLEEETEAVWGAFEGLGYKVNAELINISTPLESLVTEIEKLTKRIVRTGSREDKKPHKDDLLIIYYHGHGVVIEPGEFAIARLEKTNVLVICT